MPTTVKNPYATLSMEEAQDLKTSIEVFIEAALDMRKRLYAAFPRDVDADESGLAWYDNEFRERTLKYIPPWFHEKIGTTNPMRHAFTIVESLTMIVHSLKRDGERIAAAAEGRELTEE